MDHLTFSRLFRDWRRKLVALLGAVAVWMFVNQSITSTKTVANVPVRLVSLPQDRTVQGLLPNGILNRRVTLTLTGSKDLVKSLEASDLEVLIDASGLPDEWILQVSKKHLVSLNPEIDLAAHIQSVSNSEFVVNMSRLVTEKIPVTIASPRGWAPEGYQFLDIWPQTLFHTVTGPEEQVRALRDKGFQLVFDLNQITKAQLDELRSSADTLHADEVNFIVPERWKSVVVPFDSEMPETINDAKSPDLHISFLRKEQLPMGKNLPIRVFYPVEYADTINPQTHPLMTTHVVQNEQGVYYLDYPLLVGQVSRLFIDVVRDNMEIVVAAAPQTERDFLQWSVEFINQRDLEDTFVNLLMNDRSEQVNLKKKEVRLRRRFREYMQNLSLYKQSGQKLLLEAQMKNDGIRIKDISDAF